MTTSCLTVGFEIFGFETVGFETAAFETAGFARFAFVSLTFVATIFVTVGLGALGFATTADGVKPSAAACMGDIFDIAFSKILSKIIKQYKQFIPFSDSVKYFNLSF